ncbi:LysR family transcriptional regulator [Thaumasiovibrio sp. DFM-14]|uniref:LysR family transcriptional regulator n=1 Tax=Thaumasiovibrio sp. DFM-14 TaxID=3384792 RepID=UPI00399FD926
MSQIDWRHVDLNLLVAFYQLYQERSVTKAAAKCFVSQSAMSHNLQKLRAMFNDRLFERKGHQMVPTDRATKLAPMIDQLLNNTLSKILQEEQFDAEQYNGVCRIGLSDYAESVFAPAIYEAILAQAPSAKVGFVNVNRQDYQNAFNNEKVDIVIGSFPRLPAQFVGKKLYTESHVCLYDPKVVDIECPLSPQQFANIAQALVSPDGSFHSTVDSQLSELGLKRRVTVTSKNFLTVGNLMIGRELICIIPRRMALLTPYNQHLSRCEPPVDVGNFDISMVWLRHRAQSDKLAWLLALIERVITADEMTRSV